MTERRRRGASWSSNCFQTSSAFGFLFFTISKIPVSSRNMVPLFGATRASARRGVFTDSARALAQALLPVQLAPLRGAVGACFRAPSSRTCGHLVVAQLAASLVRKTLELIEECFCLSFRAKRGICFFLCFCRDTSGKLLSSLKNVFACHSERSEESAFFFAFVGTPGKTRS